MSSEIVPGEGAEGALPGEPSVVDMVAAALRADAADLDSYHRVLSSTVAEMLPVGMVEVERERSVKDRMSGREGRATRISVHLGELTLELATRHGGLVATASRAVRGVVISRQEVTVGEWTRLLAQHLAKVATENAEARAALGKLLGEGT